MRIEVSTKRASETDVQAFAIPVFKDEKADTGLLSEVDEATGGALRSIFETEEMTGKEGETVFVHLNNTSLRATRLLLIGVGTREDYKLPQVSEMAGTAARFLRSKNVKEIGIIPRASDEEALEATARTIEGVTLGLFDPDKYRTSDREERSLERIVVIVTDGDEAALQAAAERGRIVGEGVNFARDISNEPGMYLTPTVMAERAQETAEKFGLEIDVLDHARMEVEGMGALLGVARGSEEPAKMIVLKYTPENYTPRDGEGLLAFVGKGLTFDTGGISIKPAEGMEQMKFDMCGGAAVLGAMRAIAQLKPAIPVLGVVPSSENMPSGKAIKPGDIVTAMSGKTIEVINTDAEGRLILADALTYAQKLGATRIVDMATLTGAVVIALGDVNAAILGTDQELVNEVIEAGRAVGEKYWQLPLDKEYTKQIKSDIADIKNIGGRKAGTITAAAFLKEFVDGIAWAHLDIAGTAWTDEAKPYRSKGPTGIAVRTLLQLVEHHAKSATDDAAQKAETVSP